MNIKFKNIIIDNFMSVGHAELKLNDLGTVKVIGNNYAEAKRDKATSNGAGKSAICAESILWCLTGETNKEARNVNNLAKKEPAIVKLEVDIDTNSFIIERKNSTTKELKIIKNGKDISGNTYTKSKDILEQELGFINKDILTSIIILGQGMKGKFSELKASERKNRLEYLVGIDSLLDKIDIILENADSRITKATNELNLKITEQNTVISSSKEIIKKYSNEAPISEDEYKRVCAEYNEVAKEYNDMKTKISEAKATSQKLLLEKDKFNTDLVSITKELSALKTDINSIESNRKRIQDNIKNFNSQKELAEKAECPTCHQHLTNDEVENHIKEELSKLNVELNNLEDTSEKQERINKLVAQSNDINTKTNEIQIKINDYEKEITELTRVATEKYQKITEHDTYLKQYEQYKQERLQIDQIINDSNLKIQTATKEKTALEASLKKVVDDKNIEKYFKNAASRKFRNFLLEGVFNYINNKLKEYSSQLFTEHIIRLENNGNNIDIRLGDKYVEDLSGGECQKVNIAIQFVLRDLAKNQRGLNINLICLDEILDNLDSTAMEETIKFIEMQTADVNTMFMISHKPTNIQFDRVLVVNKGEDELTYIGEGFNYA